MTHSGRHVLVLGLGRSGRAALDLLLREGARVSAHDRDTSALEGLSPEVERLSGELPPFDDFDCVVVSPGVPVPPHAALVPEIDLAAEHLDTQLVGVTGTNGKSTATVLIGEMLRDSGIAAATGGNLGLPLCALVGADATWIVAELSSFQLEHARRLRANVGVLLNLAPDHLDRHGSLETYGRAKARLAELQEPEDVLVANLDDVWARGVAERARARVHGFSQQRAVETGAYLDGDDLVVSREGREQLRVAQAEIAAGARANALAAAAAAFAAGARPEAVALALGRFRGLPHRAERVCVRGGVRFVDDSKATNPSAAASSLVAERVPVVWIAGGRNKGLDFAPLVAAAHGVRAAILYGEAAGALASALAGATDVVQTETLERAVREAAARARPGDAVLLAPACSSFDQFGSFEERGERFATLARALPDIEAPPC